MPTERHHRHDIIKTQKTCDYCDRTHSASSWQMGRWVHRCLHCYAPYYRSRPLRFEMDYAIEQPTEFQRVSPGLFRAVDVPTSISMRVIGGWVRAE